MSFIAANMRAADWREIACQLPDGTGRDAVAAASMAGVEAWVAHYRGQPVAVLGVHAVTVSVYSAWAFGTRALRWAVPALTRFIWDERVPQWIAAGITRVEARSIASHDAAHRWMIAMGADVTPCPCWGRGGEDFILFSWVNRNG